MQAATTIDLGVELVRLGRISAKLAPPITVGATPTGTRLVIEVSDAKFEGDRLNAHQKGAAAADWLTVSPDGQVGTLDVRCTMETDDGAIVFFHYSGRSDFSKGPGTAPIYTAPQCDTGDERYAWLNKVQAVAKGRIAPDMSWIEYEVYELR